jgi:hypothetical protein
VRVKAAVPRENTLHWHQKLAATRYHTLPRHYSCHSIMKRSLSNSELNPLLSTRNTQQQQHYQSTTHPSTSFMSPLPSPALTFENGDEQVKARGEFGLRFRPLHYTTSLTWISCSPTLDRRIGGRSGFGRRTRFRS